MRQSLSRSKAVTKVPTLTKQIKDGTSKQLLKLRLFLLKLWLCYMTTLLWELLSSYIIKFFFRFITNKTRKWFARTNIWPTKTQAKLKSQENNFQLDDENDRIQYFFSDSLLNGPQPNFLTEGKSKFLMEENHVLVITR